MTRKNRQGRPPCPRPVADWNHRTPYPPPEDLYPRLCRCDEEVRLQLGPIHFEDIPEDPHDQLRLVYDLSTMNLKNPLHTLSTTIELLAQATGWQLDRY
jgi:hypothetical protein